MVRTQEPQNLLFKPKPKIIKEADASASAASQKMLDALFDDTLSLGDYLSSEAHTVEHFGFSLVPVRDGVGTLEALGITDRG
jgi:DNA-binding FadR family transcriptional regulator